MARTIRTRTRTRRRYESASARRARRQTLALAGLTGLCGIMAAPLLPLAWAHPTMNGAAELATAGGCGVLLILGALTMVAFQWAEA